MKTLYLAIKHEGGWKYVRTVQVPEDYHIGEEGTADRALVDQLLVVMSYWAGDMGHAVGNSYAGFTHPSDLEGERREK